MEREVYSELLEWMHEGKRKPLMMTGVRQCGKTFIIKKFAEENFEDVAYFDLEEDKRIPLVFENDLDPKRIIRELGSLRGKEIVPGKTILILDEIQISKRAITSMKYFNQNLPELAVIVAGSLLGVSISKGDSFPVGKVKIVNLKPMNFKEFLIANGHRPMVESVSNSKENIPIPHSYESTFEEQLKIFLITGGMPEAVADYLEKKDLASVEKIQTDIIRGYELDIAKYAPNSESVNIFQVWRSVPAQLSKENKKFMFGHVRKGARAKDLETALNWLISAGMIIKVTLVEIPNIPLSSVSDESYYKIYLSDVGLLRILCKVPWEEIKYPTDSFGPQKGAIGENFVLNELIGTGASDIHYWKGAKSEVDFVCQYRTEIVPFEVHAGKNGRYGSLRAYMEKYNPHIAVLTTMNPYEPGHPMKIPLYALWLLRRLSIPPRN